MFNEQNEWLNDANFKIIEQYLRYQCRAAHAETAICVLMTSDDIGQLTNSNQEIALDFYDYSGRKDFAKPEKFIVILSRGDESKKSHQNQQEELQALKRIKIER